MRKPEDKFNNNKVKLRKGLWPREEDEKLIKYMLSDGQGCRTDIARNAGLQRCGKSCRLRWINYLRPDLRRGAFCPQEELLILHLHSILGNRWSQIGASLTGRTNNEIKNFWNSTLKKRLKNTTTITTSTSSSLNNTDSTSNPIRGGTIFPVLHEQHVDIATTYLCADISSSSSPPSTSMLCPSTLAVNRFDQSPRQHINDPYDMSGGAQFPFNGGIGMVVVVAFFTISSTSTARLGSSPMAAFKICLLTVGEFSTEYLGLLLGAKKNSTMLQEPIIQRFCKKLVWWKASSLSLARRVVGMDESLRFWHDTWLGGYPLKNIPCEEEKNDGCIWLGNEEGTYSVRSCVSFLNEVLMAWKMFCALFVDTNPKLFHRLCSGLDGLGSKLSHLDVHTSTNLQFDCLLSDPSLAYIHWNAKKVIPSSPGWSPPPLGFLKINLDGQWRMSGIKVE
ncbi:Transcription factor MYB32 [Hibiscus syriacus]|uniref:Transcription factor MYB32 n=1 Tax=Hibiscus syriacus TaxID=106335 RepID=A0A6A2X9K6_HIBSY|nr:Transcription factor MYB32 [Hibiscus syriacus]